MTMTIVSTTDARLFREWPASAAAFEQHDGGDLFLVIGRTSTDASLRALADRFAVPVADLERFRAGHC